MQKAASSSRGRRGAGAAARRSWRRRPAPPHAATVTIDLYAVTGSTTPARDARPVTVWGYNSTDAAGDASPAGPTLVVDQGDTVHDHAAQHSCAETTRCCSQGQAMVPDRPARRPGGTTSLHLHRQPARHLPLRGRAAAQRPAPGRDGPLRRTRSCARPPAGPGLRRRRTAFDDEAVLVAQRDRPGAQQRRQPGGLRHAQVRPAVLPDQRQGLPGHRRRSRPTAGNKVLLRYVNAGIQYHSMARARRSPDASSRSTAARSPSRARYVAETFGPGQTADAHRDRRRPRRTTKHGCRLRRQPGAAQQQHRRRRRDAHLLCTIAGDRPGDDASAR